MKPELHTWYIEEVRAEIRYWYLFGIKSEIKSDVYLGINVIFNPEYLRIGPTPRSADVGRFNTDPKVWYIAKKIGRGPEVSLSDKIKILRQVIVFNHWRL